MRNAFWVSVATVAFFLAGGSATADLTASIQPESSVLTLGSMSYFDVIVSGTSVTGDRLEGTIITTLDNEGIDYTGVSSETDAPFSYVFAGSSPDQQTNELPDMQYIDFGDNTITLGETFSAGRVFFTAVQAGTYAINFDSGRSGFLHGDFSDIPTTYSGATITILPANVPEPSTTVLLGVMGVVGFGVSRLRKRPQPATTAA